MAVFSVACRNQYPNNDNNPISGGCISRVRRRRPRVLLKRRPFKVDSDVEIDQSSHDLHEDSLPSTPPAEVAASIYSDSGIPDFLTGTLTGTLDGEVNEVVETVTILLDYGASVYHQDKKGMSLF